MDFIHLCLIWTKWQQPCPIICFLNICPGDNCNNSTIIQSKNSWVLTELRNYYCIISLSVNYFSLGGHHPSAPVLSKLCVIPTSRWGPTSRATRGTSWSRPCRGPMPGSLGQCHMIRSDIGQSCSVNHKPNSNFTANLH